MRKVLVLLVMSLLVFSVFAAAANGNDGPAPNAGDGISDGSGFEAPVGPIGDGDAIGPAPNSGDGIPDGSGIDAPNGP
ncbi:hypothetical protein KJ567_07115 [Candidatus Bipolaricaulota bacterium]|nr:hypothetical protein [Candidatus Bipolaricaulota bacterium]